MSKFFTDAKKLSERIIAKDFTLSQAARAAHLSAGKFIPLAKYDTQISRRTANKLRATFGSEVVTEVDHE